ncbi:hypothetical protein [Sinomonas humi]|uniref:Uncharacterized protein n=1 Tax=Sinomonas humi TaxID=1338436 RepID=A0A0B2APB5_9MICC|nr:hypothetical protein [Sinomonas humi]KHL03792.1 hypothetical protein LK10_08360 [Sinomonas humi]
MQFLVVLAHVAVAALIVWWTRRSWASKPTLAQRLEQAGFKAGVGLILDFLVAGNVANIGGVPVPHDVYDVVMAGVYVFLFAAAALYLATFVAGIIGGIRAREAMRLSGHPVPPRLRAPWKIALGTAAAAFFLFLGAMFVAQMWLYTARQAFPLDPRLGDGRLPQEWIIGGGIGFWAAVALAWAVQHVRIWKAEREYAQLTTGIEHRLEEQRRSLLADAEGEA